MAEEKKKEKDKSLVPGFGVSGQVMCGMSLMAPKLCVKQGCEWWVELTYPEGKVARCAMPWLVVVATEIRQSIDKLNQRLAKEGDKDAPTKESDPSPE